VSHGSVRQFWREERNEKNGRGGDDRRGQISLPAKGSGKEKNGRGHDESIYCLLYWHDEGRRMGEGMMKVYIVYYIGMMKGGDPSMPLRKGKMKVYILFIILA